MQRTTSVGKTHVINMKNDQILTLSGAKYGATVQPGGQLEKVKSKSLHVENNPV